MVNVLGSVNGGSVAASSGQFGYSYGKTPSEYPSDRSASVNLGHTSVNLPSSIIPKSKP